MAVTISLPSRKPRLALGSLLVQISEHAMNRRHIHAWLSWNVSSDVRHYAEERRWSPHCQLLLLGQHHWRSVYSHPTVCVVKSIPPSSDNFHSSCLNSVEFGRINTQWMCQCTSILTAIFRINVGQPVAVGRIVSGVCCGTQAAAQFAGRTRPCTASSACSVLPFRLCDRVTHSPASSTRSLSLATTVPCFRE